VLNILARFALARRYFGGLRCRIFPSSYYQGTGHVARIRTARFKQRRRQLPETFEGAAAALPEGDAAPTQHYDLSVLSLEELNEFERIVKKATGAGRGEGGEASPEGA
jgi:hypothetical protein